MVIVSGAVTGNVALATSRVATFEEGLGLPQVGLKPMVLGLGLRALGCEGLVHSSPRITCLEKGKNKCAETMWLHLHLTTKLN